MSTSKLTVSELRETARLIRRDALAMISTAASGHPGGSLSMTDYGTALFFAVARLDPANPDWEGRDQIIISNGHCSPFNYSALARLGYFPVADLLGFRTLGNPLQGHPNHLKVAGLEASTGSLGQGLSQGVGKALGARLQGRDTRVFVNVGDGELQEGSCWEAFMSAAHFGLDNMFVLIDDNDAQIDGRVKDVMNVHPLDKKLAAFNFNVITCDGHDMEKILAAYDEALSFKNGKPTAIIWKTIMMKGVPSYEDDNNWHGNPPKEEHFAIALKELGFDQTPAQAYAEIGGTR
jgi:transketolase